MKSVGRTQIVRSILSKRPSLAWIFRQILFLAEYPPIPSVIKPNKSLIDTPSSTFINYFNAPWTSVPSLPIVKTDLQTFEQWRSSELKQKYDSLRCSGLLENVTSRLCIYNSYFYKYEGSGMFSCKRVLRFIALLHITLHLLYFCTLELFIRAI